LYTQQRRHKPSKAHHIHPKTHHQTLSFAQFFSKKKKITAHFSLTQYRQIFKKRNFKKIIFFTLHCLKE